MVTDLDYPLRMRTSTAGYVLAATLVLTAAPLAQQQQGGGYDYWRVQRAMIQRGQQAIFMCNGLFTSKRTLEQVFAQELKYLQQPIGTPAGGDYVVDRERRAVAIGKDDGVPVMRAAFREGLGCVGLALSLAGIFLGLTRRQRAATTGTSEAP